MTDLFQSATDAYRSPAKFASTLLFLGKINNGLPLILFSYALFSYNYPQINR